MCVVGWGEPGPIRLAEERSLLKGRGLLGLWFPLTDPTA